MNEELFNLEVRQFLKRFGIAAQREIEKAVDAGLASGRLAGTETLKAHASLTIDGLPMQVQVDGAIALA